MNTETKLREAMKVVEAARNYSSAIDGRVVRQTQDKLYKAVRIFDGLMATEAATKLVIDMEKAHKDTANSTLKFP